MTWAQHTPKTNMKRRCKKLFSRNAQSQQNKFIVKTRCPYLRNRIQNYRNSSYMNCCARIGKNCLRRRKTHIMLSKRTNDYFGKRNREIRLFKRKRKRWLVRRRWILSQLTQPQLTQCFAKRLDPLLSLRTLAWVLLIFPSLLEQNGRNYLKMEGRYFRKRQIWKMKREAKLFQFRKRRIWMFRRRSPSRFSKPSLSKTKTWRKWWPRCRSSNQLTWNLIDCN